MDGSLGDPAVGAGHLHSCPNACPKASKKKSHRKPTPELQTIFAAEKCAAPGAPQGPRPRWVARPIVLLSAAMGVVHLGFHMRSDMMLMTRSLPTSTSNILPAVSALGAPCWPCGASHFSRGRAEPHHNMPNSRKACSRKKASSVGPATALSGLTQPQLPDEQTQAPKWSCQRARCQYPAATRSALPPPRPLSLKCARIEKNATWAPRLPSS